MSLIHKNTAKFFKFCRMSKIIVGVCAIDIKARSKPMRNILDKLLSYGEFEVVLFGDHVILEEPIEDWPFVDVLLSFFSRGFPLEKAIEYVRLRRPFCVNDLSLQHVLLDRRSVMLVLDAIDVRTPFRLVVNRDSGPALPAEVVELVSRDFNIDLSNSGLFPQLPVRMLDFDTLQVGRRILRKPFIEKPVNSEDHNLYVYYPQLMGGGCRKLFRKLANKSSEFFPELTMVREDGSYIYEEFLEAENAEDVKVYTVGLDYAHAETRKSPVIDGLVRRNAEGKEIRVEGEMSADEQEIARRVCMAFGQTICGFDILRYKGRSFVVDVNGWSFVKGSETYLEKCTSILRKTFIHAVVSKRNHLSLRTPVAETGQWRLKCYVAVFRHGDRTPKQKMKMTVTDAEFLALLPTDYGGEDVIIRERLLLIKAFRISESVLAKLGSNDEDYPQLKKLVDVLGKKMLVPGTKLQLRKIVRGESPSMLLIIKWGGDFTHAGRHQTKDLGESLRKELTILNKLLLDDVRIFCSAERRVMATSEVFAKALLAIAEVAPAFISVLKEALDDSFVSKDDIYRVKRLIGERLVEDKSYSSIVGCADDPVGLLQELKARMQYHRDILKENFANDSFDWESVMSRWCCSDSPALFKERWDRHFSDVLEGSTDWFDPSKLSDLYDSLKFDALHHRPFLEAMFTSRTDKVLSLESLHTLYLTAQKLFGWVAPREYGSSPEERLRIGRQISGLLMQRVVSDLLYAMACDHATTRFYFTKESHMTALLNILQTCGLPLGPATPEETIDPCRQELDYLSHICLELYERIPVEGDLRLQRKHSLRIGISNGAHTSRMLDVQVDACHAVAVTGRRWLSGYMDGMSAVESLAKAIGGIEEGYRSGRSVRKSSEPMCDP